MRELLERINQLANEEKVENSGVEERQEQHQLRQKYLGMIRGQVLRTFSAMRVVDPLGQDMTPDKVYALREEYSSIQEN